MQILPPPIKLDAPGAGIPWFKKIFLRLFVMPFVARKTSFKQSKANFEKITLKILQEIEALSDEDLQKQVLVNPINGIEDSSRFWSISMTLEHLFIVGTKIMNGLLLLQKGQLPPEEADTAKVKPLGQMSAIEAITVFKQFAVVTFPSIPESITNSNLKYAHPWFGPMTAKEWHWLLAIHQGLHLKQIRQIKQGLGK